MSVVEVYSMIDGQRINHTHGSGNTWTAAGTAPIKSSWSQPNHVYAVVTYAKDDAGNIETYESTLKVVEKTPPVITPVTPTTGSTLTNNKPAITWNVTDDDSGVNPDTIGITIDSNSKITGSAIQKESITNGYKCTYTPTSALGDGSHTVKFDASDNDGNAAAQKSITLKIDTVPPTLNVTNPAEGLITNNATLTVSGTTNDATSSPVTLKVNDKTVTVQENGSWSTQITLSEGQNTITVVATDAAGKSTTVTRHVTLDTGAPEITQVTITPNPADAGASITITAIVTDD